MVRISKNLVIVAVCMLLLGVIMSAGCVSDDADTGADDTTSTGDDTTSPTSTTTEESSESSDGSSLSDLLDLAKGSTSATYDLVISGGVMQPMTSKVWSTETMERMDSTIMGMKSITIIDKEAMVMYMYNPDEHTAMMMDMDPDNTAGSSQSFEEIVEEYNPTVIGTETIDGKKCTIIQYEVVTDDVAVTQKAWIWQVHGFPIKFEMTSTLGGSPVTTVIEMRNIEFGPIDDSIFKLPAGVDIQEFEIPEMPEMPQ
ncbi:MAG: hypothetical protein SYNGOMJ08_00294 [Candidatus Syntrophoarchaeum sp. GoM_oil]|nr:MAG: hypothetical protein SYNGOMJ08_00294 [Candidatus Syntrophoarchaeum sp. GoM_oil]